MTFSTSEVAETVGVSLRTIRFWEYSGIFGEVERDNRGDRAFTEDQRDFARVAQASVMIGKSLPEIAELRSRWKSELAREAFRGELVTSWEFLKSVHDAIYKVDYDL